MLALVGMLAVAGASFLDGHGRADVGVIDTSATVAAAREAQVDFEIPAGSVEVRAVIGSEVERASGDSGARGRRIRAPRGGLLVQVAWTVQSADRKPVAGGEHQSTRLWLRADGERHQVPRRKDHTIVAVPAAGDTVVLELEFAGKRQSVDLVTGERRLGAFAPLYRAHAGSLGGDVGWQTGERRDGLSWSSDWSPALRRTPYLPGLGWAKPGREWLHVVDAELRITALSTTRRGKDDQYAVATSDDARATLSVSGARVVRAPKWSITSDPTHGARYTSGPAIYDVARGAAVSLQLTARAPLRAVASDAQETIEPLVLTRTITVTSALEPGANT